LALEYTYEIEPLKKLVCILRKPRTTNGCTADDDNDDDDDDDDTYFVY
jgi:hypothetical protein